MNDLKRLGPSDIHVAQGDPESLVGYYFRDASRFELLSEPEERRLSARLTASLNTIARDQGLPEDVPVTLRDVIGDRLPGDLNSQRARRCYVLARGCRERLIRSNLRLAVHIARRHANRGLPMSDLIQDGNVGLIKAVERFDPSKGFRFSTYAYWWITEEVKRCMKRGGRVVRTPDHIIDEIRALQATTLRLHRQLGRTPRQSELAQELEVSPGRVNQLMGFAASEVSTATPVSDEGSLTIGDALNDDEGVTPDGALVPRDQRRLLAEILADLTEREQTVLSRRFGLGRPEPETLQVISEELGISRERVRQIEKAALAKLKGRYANLGDMAGN